jgi:hypothetical protein
MLTCETARAVISTARAHEEGIVAVVRIEILRNTLVDGQPVGLGDTVETDPITAQRLVNMDKARYAIREATAAKAAKRETATAPAQRKGTKKSPSKDSGGEE